MPRSARNLTIVPTPPDPVELVRLRIQRTVRTFLTGSAAPPRRDQDRLDPGLFGPDSATWQVHADTSMLIGGLRALLLQSLHPLTMAGVAEHSDFRNDPLGRLQRTAAYIGITTYGSTAEAKAAIRHIRRIHDMVTGTAPDGRPYRANDPHLLGWVHATEVDSFLAAYQRYGGRPLTAARQDAYVAEMAQLGRLVGVRKPPRTTAELRATLDTYRPELSAGRQARDAVRFLLVPPFPLAARPLYGVIAGAAVSLLPWYARRLLWIPIAPGTEPLLVRPAATALVRVLGWALASPTSEVAVSA
jgi:uncharacterized protein (DUF2236 family)